MGLVCGWTVTRSTPSVLASSGSSLTRPSQVARGLIGIGSVPVVTYHNQMRERGYSVWETCMRGTELRIRPVVMTSLTAALGLLPAALAVSIGSRAQKPLAVVVVGAMFCTLFLTRYIMPVLYS